MSATLSIYEAKTHFSSYVQRAAAGESFVITSHGTPMAKITPLKSADEPLERSARIAASLEKLKELQSQSNWPKATVEEILSWSKEGRKW